MERIDSFTGEFRFLSNFYPAKVKLDGESYPSVEHAYQAAKTLDKKDRKKIATLKASGAKSYGRKVKMRPDWEKVKLGIMEDLVFQKFSNEPTMREMLVITDPLELVEGNDWNDTFWGVCNGKGENHLGKILMRVRARLK